MRRQSSVELRIEGCLCESLTPLNQARIRSSGLAKIPVEVIYSRFVYSEPVNSWHTNNKILG